MQSGPGGMTRKQLRALDRLALASEDGRVLATDEISEFDPAAKYAQPLHTLHALERRHLVKVVDDTEEPYLWRATLAGVTLARAWRGRLPALSSRGGRGRA